MKHKKTVPFDRALLQEALRESVKKLGLRTQLKNPVMFLVYFGAIFTTLWWLYGLMGGHSESSWFTISIALWLWGTTLFANFAEAVAEGRAKAQAHALKDLKKSTNAYKLKPAALKALESRTVGTLDGDDAGAEDSASTLPWLMPENLECVDSTLLQRADVVVVRAGEIIPCDGEVIKGIASVNESAITGESAPVIREAGGDFSSVTGGTTVLSDWIVVRVDTKQGESFIDKMIAMVEGASRRKTPNEVALTILLLALTIIFVLVVATMLPFSHYAVDANGAGTVVSYTVLIALLVCLIPTTIGGLLSAIGVAGMSRLLGANVIARSGRAVEASGDVDVLLLDKTGTITYGNRQAAAFFEAQGVSKEELAAASLLSSLADDTPEGKSIVNLAKKYTPMLALPPDATFVPFSAQTKMSGVNVKGHNIRKGAPDAILRYLRDLGVSLDAHKTVLKVVDEVASRGSTPLLVADGAHLLGVVELKDIVKPGIRERFDELRTMGIKTVMITGDNPLTAAAIAAEAGVDDFLAEATPESKLKTIRRYQSEGHLVAMTGDGTNDAPALAQSDVAVAMNTGTQSAKEAANMVDLDSSPTKLIDIVKIGKQMLITRGALTTFSIANDLAKYFAIIPAAFASTYPSLQVLNVMGLASPQSALLSAIIFNALIIIALIPLALRGVTYRPLSAASWLKRNLLLYGLGGIITPFIGIKLIDLILEACALV